MKTHLKFILLLFLPFLGVSQQQYTGLSNDNFAGYVTSFSNPATIVNTPSKYFINLSFVSLRSNNYLGNNTNVLSLLFNNEQERYREHLTAGYQMNNLSFDIISGYYEINHKNSIGYSLRSRQFGNTDGLPNELTQAKDNDFGTGTPTGTPIAYKNLFFSQLIYTEHRFHYARVVMEDNPHFLKAGVALKLLNGLDATYLYSEEGTFEFQNANSPFATFNDALFEYGIAENQNSFTNRNIALGADLGVVYEYRPNPEKYRYDMDGETNIERYDEKKYLFKAAASINDIGRIKFTKDTSSYDFISGATPIDADDISSLGFGGIDFGNINIFKDFNQYAQQGTPFQGNESTFNMSLPTTFNLQGDYHIWKNIYANWSSAIPLKFPGDANKSYFKAIHSATPRYETKKVSLMLPITFQRNAQINLGMAFRYMFSNDVSIYFGGNNITGFIGKRSSYTQNFFFGIAYSKMYTVPKDTDGDKISDPKDDCIYDAGPMELNGCPDTDKDGIPDKEDLCIFDPGPKRTNGCPDRDEDGIIDINDQCPDDTGLGVHYGCPDKDKDGIIDFADRCPDVAGIEMNNGCPMEVLPCCTDNDGDGFPNDLDLCPEVAGSVYNNGCPMDQAVMDSLNLQDIKIKIDPNHTAQKVDSIRKNVPEEERTSNLIEKDKKPMGDDYLNVYFGKDDASLEGRYDEEVRAFARENKDAFKFVVVGHTDDDGTENYNLILSKKRADVVKRKLMDEGIPASNIEVMFFGEWKPLKRNDTKEEKSKNRRVEIILQKEKPEDDQDW